MAPLTERAEQLIDHEQTRDRLLSTGSIPGQILLSTQMTGEQDPVQTGKSILIPDIAIHVAISNPINGLIVTGSNEQIVSTTQQKPELETQPEIESEIEPKINHSKTILNHITLLIEDLDGLLAIAIFDDNHKISYSENLESPRENNQTMTFFNIAMKYLVLELIEKVYQHKPVNEIVTLLSDHYLLIQPLSIYSPAKPSKGNVNYYLSLTLDRHEMNLTILKDRLATLNDQLADRLSLNPQ